MLKKIKAVFLPGKLCDKRVWAESMGALEDIVEPLFIDLRPQNNLEEMLSSIFDCCEGRFFLIGFSMGGYVAQEFALKFTHRLLGVALVGTCADAYNEEDKTYQLKMVANVKEHGLKHLSVTSLYKFIHHSLYENTALIELIQDMAKQSGTEVFLTQHLATIERRSRLSDLSKLTCPTIVIGGRDDQVVKITDIEKMAFAIPKSQLCIIENCGHMIPLEQTKVLNEILRNWINTLLL